jgi:hypothetical protein
MTQAPITICPGCEDATLAHNYIDDVCESPIALFAEVFQWWYIGHDRSGSCGVGANAEECVCAAGCAFCGVEHAPPDCPGKGGTAKRGEWIGASPPPVDTCAAGVNRCNAPATHGVTIDARHPDGSRYVTGYNVCEAHRGDFSDNPTRTVTEFARCPGCDDD